MLKFNHDWRLYQLNYFTIATELVTELFSDC